MGGIIVLLCSLTKRRELAADIERTDKRVGLGRFIVQRQFDMKGLMGVFSNLIGVFPDLSCHLLTNSPYHGKLVHAQVFKLPDVLYSGIPK